jgi:hypothetical protein
MIEKDKKYPLVDKHSVDALTWMKDEPQGNQHSNNDNDNKTPQEESTRIDLAVVSIHAFICNTILLTIVLVCQAFEISVTVTLLFAIIFILIVSVQLTPYIFPISKYINDLIENTVQKFKKKQSSDIT